jgi:hypothetical protein
VGGIFSVMSVSRRIRENYIGMILKVGWKRINQFMHHLVDVNYMEYELS